MAKIRITVIVHASWVSTDKLRVYRGSENAASLAASTPTGGNLVETRAVGTAAPGSDLTFDFGYSPTDKCATLPVGVILEDAAGNQQTVLQTTVALRDPPRAPGRPSVAATANPGEATLAWAASPDLPPEA